MPENHALDITNIWHHQQCQKIKGTSSWSLVQQYTVAQRYFNISVFPQLQRVVEQTARFLSKHRLVIAAITTCYVVCVLVDGLSHPKFLMNGPTVLMRATRGCEAKRKKGRRFSPTHNGVPIQHVFALVSPKCQAFFYFFMFVQSCSDIFCKKSHKK